MNWWTSLSALGALSVTGPVALALALWLAIGHGWRLALYWCLVFGGAMALVVASKIAFIGWGLGVEAIRFAGFSGHAARAAAVFPLVGFVLLPGLPGRGRAAGVLFGVLCAALVSAARVAVLAHTVSEAALGFALGLGVAALLMARARSAPPFAWRPELVLGATLLLALSWGAEPSPSRTEQCMVDLALRLSGHARPYSRQSWKMAGAAPPVRRGAPPHIHLAEIQA